VGVGLIFNNNMDYTDTLTVVTNALTDFGVSVFTILELVVLLCLAYVVYYLGWKHLKGSLK